MAPKRGMQQVKRWLRLWRRDVRDGWLTLGRFRVAPSSSSKLM